MTLVITISLALPAYGADRTPVQLALINPVQVFPETTSVQGLRINLIYGVNANLQGLDWGLVNRVTQATSGLQLGAFPVGGVNITGDLKGLQLGGVWGGVNIAEGDATGMQLLGILGGGKQGQASAGDTTSRIFRRKLCPNAERGAGRYYRRKQCQ